MTETASDVALQAVTYAQDDWEARYDATLAGGRITAIMGASGSGKSTLLDLVAGFRVPTAGRILIGGSDVTRLPPAARPVSMIFQENNLFSHLSVEANVGLGLSPGLKLTASDRDRISAALQETGLAGKERRLPGQLSGGERQRVALARVLVRDRPVMLLDEAFSSLGPALRQEMLALVADLHRRSAMTVLMVTHHPDDAVAIADDVLLVADGRIAAQGRTATMLGEDAPAAMRDYLGKDRSVRKAT